MTHDANSEILAEARLQCFLHFQDIVRRWRQEKAPDCTYEGQRKKLIDELWEAKAEASKEEPNLVKLATEVIDILWVMTNMLDLRNVQLEYLVSAKVIKNFSRTWGAAKDGKCQHTENAA